MSQAVLKAFLELVPREQDAASVYTAEQIRQVMRQIELFPAVALPSPAAATVICGLVHFQGKGELWMITGQGFEKTARAVLAQQKQLAKTFYRALGLRRLHLLVDAHRADAMRWAELIGFRREFPTPLKNYGAYGQDQFMFIFSQGE
jgi:hypothetical protein